MTVATALEAQYTQFLADASELTDTRLQLEVNVLIERWYAAASTYSTEESTAIQSYSTVGRSVSRRQLGDLKRQVDELYSEIHQILYGRGVALVECRVDSSSGLPG